MRHSGYKENKVGYEYCINMYAQRDSDIRRASWIEMKVKNPTNKAYYTNENQTFIHHYPDQFIMNYTLEMIFHLAECYANLEQIYRRVVIQLPTHGTRTTWLHCWSSTDKFIILSGIITRNTPQVITQFRLM